MDNEEMIERMSFSVEDYLKAVEKSKEEDRRRWKQQRRQELLEFLGALLMAFGAATPVTFLLAVLAVKVAGG